MRLEDYDIKHIVKTDRTLLKRRKMNVKIEDKTYDFIIFDAKNAIIEFGVFIPYTSLKASNGPIERNLNEMLYHDIIDYEGFFSNNFFFEPEFIIDDTKYVLKMAGSGPIALKLILELTYSEINSSDRPIERKLRNYIISIYNYEMKNNPDLKNKFERILEKNKEDNERKEEILNDVREKEKKMKEIEDHFDFYKPRDKSRYKIR